MGPDRHVWEGTPRRGLDRHGIPAALLFQVGSRLWKRTRRISVAFGESRQFISFRNEDGYYGHLLKETPRQLTLRVTGSDGEEALKRLLALVDDDDPGVLESAGYAGTGMQGLTGHDLVACMRRLAEVGQLGQELFVRMDGCRDHDQDTRHTTWVDSDNLIARAGQSGSAMVYVLPHLNEQVAALVQTVHQATSRNAICNWELGLHARTSAWLTKIARGFESEISIYHGDSCSNAKSIFGILLLGLEHGCEVTVRAEGPDAAVAVDAVSHFIEQSEEY